MHCWRTAYRAAAVCSMTFVSVIDVRPLYSAIPGRLAPIPTSLLLARSMFSGSLIVRSRSRSYVLVDYGVQSTIRHRLANTHNARFRTPVLDYRGWLSIMLVGYRGSTVAACRRSTPLHASPPEGTRLCHMGTRACNVSTPARTGAEPQYYTHSRKH